MNRGQFFKTITLGLLGAKYIIANKLTEPLRVEDNDAIITQQQVMKMARQTGKYRVRGFYISWYCNANGEEYGNALGVVGDYKSIDSGFDIIKKHFEHWYLTTKPRVPDIKLLRFQLHSYNGFSQDLIETIELKKVNFAYIKELKFSKEDELT